MRLDLGPNTQQELSLAEFLQVPGLVGQVHRVPRKGDGDTGCDIQAGRMIHGANQWQERIPTAFKRIDPIVTNGLQAFRLGTRIGQLGIKRPVDFHVECIRWFTTVNGEA